MTLFSVHVSSLLLFLHILSVELLATSHKYLRNLGVFCAHVAVLFHNPS